MKLLKNLVKKLLKNKLLLLAIVLVVIAMVYFGSSRSSEVGLLSEGFNSVPTEITQSSQLEGETGKLKIVKFYAPWCGHCKAMADDWNKFEQTHHTKQVGGNTVLILSVNGDDQPEICKKYGVNGFPTIKAFRGDGQVAEFNKERSVDGFNQFLNEQSK